MKKIQLDCLHKDPSHSMQLSFWSIKVYVYPSFCKTELQFGFVHMVLLLFCIFTPVLNALPQFVCNVLIMQLRYVTINLATAPNPQLNVNPSSQPLNSIITP